MPEFDGLQDLFALDGRTALVTGGTRGIGEAISLGLAAAGADVVPVSRTEADVEATVESVRDLGASSLVAPLDVTDDDAVRATVERVADELGGVDVLVNNAAMVDARSQVKDYDDDTWDRDMAVNLTGTYNITRQVFPGMCDRGWGRVINMSSMAGTHGGFGQASYSSTKAAMIGLGKTLALEGAQNGVTSNVIAPSIVVGALADMDIDTLENMDEYFARIAKATPMRKLGKEEDVANLIAYLSSEQANYITGQVIGVTGGVDLFSF